MRPRAEAVAALLLLGCAGLAVAFVALFFAHPDTQLLGVALGGSLALLAAALVVAAHRVVPQEEAEEQRPRLLHEEEVARAAETLAGASEGISRRGLLAGAAGAAGAALTAALVVPASSLGPSVGSRIADTPWRRGRALVDADGLPIAADDLEPGMMLTAFPEGASQEELGAPVVLVRLDPDELDLTHGREGWAPEGIVAYSKICTHAGCAVSEYRYPLYEPTSRGPALVCPCHYSTFDVRRGAEVLFGPAARSLPQLPLMLDAQRRLLAAGGLSAPPGPSWAGVRS